MYPPHAGAGAPASPPFSAQDLKLAIPAHCFVPHTGRSLAYMLRDLGAIALLAAGAIAIDSWYVWPLYWLLQGTMMWALFVVGHDCGHGSFSRSKLVNDVAGHLCHAPLLVPFHGWRISHRIHHAYTGNVEMDESWYPLTKGVYHALPWYGRLLRYWLPLLSFPAYLLMRSPGRRAGSHFNPHSPLFRADERSEVLASSASVLLFLAILAMCAGRFGLGLVACLYVVPYLVFCAWLSFVTFMQHTSPEVPWYRGKDWTRIKGVFSTIDYDYGWFNRIQHHIGTHVVHHCFTNIPHYHLEAANAGLVAAVGHVEDGGYYRRKSEPLLPAFFKAQRECLYVPSQGSPVYYQDQQAVSTPPKNLDGETDDSLISPAP